MTVSGSGFAPNAGLTIIINGQVARIGYTTADSSGNMAPTPVTIPATLSPGAHTLSVVNASAHVGASAQLTLANPVVTVAPGTVAPGGQVTVSGSGFAPNAGLTIIINGQTARIGYTTADSNGNMPPTPVTIPSTLVTGAHTLSVVNASAHNGGSAQVIVGPGSAKISITPGTVAPGDQVTISGSGFSPNAGLTIIINGQTARIGYTTADSNGNMPPTPVTIPSTLATGAHIVSVVNASAHRGASIALVVANPTVNVTPNIIAPGGQVTVSGSGFAPNAGLTIIINGQTARIGYTTADSNGNMAPTPVTIPSTLAIGIHTLSVVNASAHNGGSAQIDVSSAPMVRVTPSTVAPGGQVTVSGSGFAPNAGLTIIINGQAARIGYTTADSNGNMAPTPVTIPATLSPGAHTLSVVNANAHVGASAQLTLTAPLQATLVATPSTTNRGGTTTLTGGNWAPSEAITVTLSGVTTPITVVHATAQGAFPSTVITIPYAATQGTQTLTAMGEISKRTATATVTLATVTATFAVTPPTTNRGGLITLSGGSFAPNEAVTITVDGVITPLATITATAQGTLSATGVSIPYSIPAGPHTLRATGAISKRAATAGITVAALTPSISLNPSAAAPGATVTVTGKGFGRQERVTLALNGQAVTTTAPITTADGAFSAAFMIPNTVINGLNTVSAVGNESRVTAVTALTGVLPRSPRFYFAGGLNTATEHSVVQVLNTNDQPASLRLTFYFENGASYTELATVAAHAQAVIPVAQYRLQAGTFGLQLNADRPVSAQMTITRDGRDGDTLLGNTAPGTTWYLAEGYTGLTFHETVSILNPDPTVAAHAQLQLLPFGGRPGRVVSVTVAPHATLVTDINALLPGQSLSIVATADRPVVVERTLTFSTPGPTGAPGGGVTGYGMTTRAGSNTPATSWLLAEGTTVTRFQTYLTILNPTVTPALVTASFFSRSGASLGSKTIVVDGRSRANIKLNDLFYASGVASVVTSNQPIVVERPEYFGSPNGYRVAGSDVFGRNGAGVRWSFPAGNTQGLSEFLLVFNPSATTVPIDVVAYGGNGQTLTRRVLVPPTVRYNIDVGQLFAGFDPQHGIVLQSASGVGFVAEQTVFAPDYSALRSTQGLAQ